MSEKHGNIEVVERLVAPPELRGRTTFWYDLKAGDKVIATVYTNDQDAHDMAEAIKHLYR